LKNASVSPPATIPAPWLSRTDFGLRSSTVILWACGGGRCLRARAVARPPSDAPIYRNIRYAKDYNDVVLLDLTKTSRHRTHNDDIKFGCCRVREALGPFSVAHIGPWARLQEEQCILSSCIAFLLISVYVVNLS
jgi:hypothetical protein